MPSVSHDVGSYMLRHLGQIATGECSITQEEILAFHERGDDVAAEILAGLLFLHDILHRREQALRASNEQLEQALQDLRDQNEELSESRAALADLAVALATPIIKAGKGVLLAPLIGALDEARAAATTERILRAVSKEKTRALILDMTGVSAIDSRSASDFERIIRAVKLLGARTILAGMQPQVAASVVGIGADTLLADVTAVRDVQEALRLCSEEPGPRR